MTRAVLPPPIRAANEALAFVLELVMMGAFAAWGGTRRDGFAVRVAGGIGVPLAAAIVWGTLLAPRARVHPPIAVVVVLKVILFLAAAAAIDGLGWRAAAIAFAAVALVNTAVVTADRAAQ
jgi:hypothetical protein